MIIIINVERVRKTEQNSMSLKLIASVDISFVVVSNFRMQFQFDTTAQLLTKAKCLLFSRLFYLSAVSFLNQWNKEKNDDDEQT